MRGRLAVDALMVAYLTGTAGLLAAQDEAWPWLALRGLVLIGLGLARLGRLPAWLHLHYPLPLCYLLYLELDHYAPLTGGVVHDDLVLGWEERLFGSSPALWLSQLLPFRALSEGLHLGYLCFYFMAPGLLLALIRQRRPDRIQALQLMVSLVWITSFLCFIFFPVEGPRPRFPPLDVSLQGPIHALCHWLSGAGAARAAAFPSVHAALGGLVWMLAWRWDRRLAIALLPLTAALLGATVYGRFHYALDTLAGLLLALGLVRAVRSCPPMSDSCRSSSG